MPRRDGRSRLLSEEASPAAMELVARALDGTPTADEFGRPWVGSVAEMPDEFAADSAAQIQAAFRGLVSRATALPAALRGRV